MKMKIIASILFLVFISMISFKTSVTKLTKLNAAPNKFVAHSVVAGVW